jgi:ubiquinone/menaquinone biosynthesis C-methylase UbiE
MTDHERMFSHQQASKLDDPEREKWLPRATVLEELRLRSGMRVADIGAGTGYFAIPVARAIAPEGRVFAVDVQPQMLALLRERLEPGAAVVLVEGSAGGTTLAERSVELALYVNVWHEIDDREAALTEASRILEPGGRIVLVDWRADVAQPPGPPLHHRLAASDAEAGLRERGWKVERTATVGAFSYLLVAVRR